jgi:hypothetical protein
MNIKNLIKNNKMFKGHPINKVKVTTVDSY